MDSLGFLQRNLTVEPPFESCKSLLFTSRRSQGEQCDGAISFNELFPCGNMAAHGASV
jgi:hypothetical protein